MGRLKTQVRKTKVLEDGICKYGIRKYESATVETASTELKEYFEEFTIFHSSIFSRSAVSRSRPVYLYCTRQVLYTRNRTHAGLIRAQKGLGS